MFQAQLHCYTLDSCSSSSLPKRHGEGGEWGLGSDHCSSSLPLLPLDFPLLQHVSLTQAVKLQDKVAPTWGLDVPLPQGTFPFSSAEPQRLQGGYLLRHSPLWTAGKNCSNRACPTAFQGMSAPAPAALLLLLLPCPWSQSCLSHTLTECSSH